ncbi:T9SS type B sorting domain-containing protein [uncultured Flavobacterium sp.]|uniref:DUF7948 domain-containing protein n=1 Tax=uncultured Flavobacterium sp. TaxID=165435 RepID=UPI0025CBD477|nr:T9SS type B sorting domain-containing protein [uncultured Flavobacterium sp.]
MKQILFTAAILFYCSAMSQHINQSKGFKENKGQILNQDGKPNNEVKFLLTHNGLNIQLRKNGFSYDVYEKRRANQMSPLSDMKNIAASESNTDYQLHRIDVDFINAAPNAKLIASHKSRDFSNYYNVPGNANGVIGVHEYGNVIYKNIYPHIDIVFTVPEDAKKAVEYNFIIHPKGKISDIKLKFKGARTNLKNNKIQINTAFGIMEEILPESWIEEKNRKRKIDVTYDQVGNNMYGFNAKGRILNKTVIIDPVPVRLWGTYHGGEGADFVASVFTKNNFSYIGGNTFSKLNMASNGAHQNTFGSLNASYDSFFAKFNADGTRLWATYYGGSKSEDIFKIVVSDNDNVYVGGSTMSDNNIATPGSHQQAHGNYWDGFLAKFDKDGVRQWGTYYGGLSNDDVKSITLDSNENIYIVGATYSKENIADISSFKSSLDSFNTGDGFIAKFNRDGRREWGTYYGGTGQDIIYDSKVDTNGNIIIIGSTFSKNGIATANSFQETHTTSDREGFLAKFTSNGNLVWGTYFGGEKTDFFHDLGIDSHNNLYCLGQTNSATGIATAGIFQENFIANGSGNNGAILKFDPNGFKIWGSYFYPEALGLSVTKNGTIYFTGRTKAGFSATPNAYMENPYSNASGTDSFLVKFSTDGERKWSTYFSGEAADDALSTAADENGNLYLAGSTQSLLNIATPGTHQNTNYTNLAFNSGDAFLVKFNDCESNSHISSNSPICIGQTLELAASGGTAYNWSGPNGFTSQDQNPAIANAAAINSGEYNCIISGAPGSCPSTLSLKAAIGDNIAPIPTIAVLADVRGSCQTIINTIPTATDNCAGLITATTENSLDFTLPGIYTVTWNYNDGNGNISKQNQKIIIEEQPLPIANSQQTFCFNDHLNIENIEITGINIKWYDDEIQGNIIQKTTALADNQIYYASQTLNGCESRRIPIHIKIVHPNKPSTESNQSFCSDQNPIISDLKITGEITKWYDSETAGTLLPKTAILENNKIYYASQTVFGCESERIPVRVNITGKPLAPTGDTNPIFCKSKNATLNNISINGQNLKWYDANTAITALSPNTVLQNGTTYYASQTIACESEKLPVSVTVLQNDAPIAESPQFFCASQNAVLKNIAIMGQNIMWFDSAIGGNILNETTKLNNTIYYASQNLNGCESPRKEILVKIIESQSPDADPEQNFCSNQNANISFIKVYGQNIRWYSSLLDETNLSESTLIEDGKTYYASQTIDNCESMRTPVKINIKNAAVDCPDPSNEISFPKFFTPNDDGYNDTWIINSEYLATGSIIRIYDRFGRLITALTTNNSWDGTYKGLDMPSSDYWFVATAANGNEFKGHFSLKR